MLAVTMKRDLIERCRAAAAERDLRDLGARTVVFALDGQAGS